MQDPFSPTGETTEVSEVLAGKNLKDLQEEKPCMVILYHGELNRIGFQTAPPLFEEGGWVELGRYHPLFVNPLDRDEGSALEDRRISRLQGRLRWSASREVFEVAPSPRARKPLQRVVFSHTGGVHLEPLASPSVCEPGTLLAVGQRALILLTRRAWRSSEGSRMGMVGESRKLWSLREEIGSIARFERSVLVLGETGAGKELVARAIHEQSPRRRAPFVAVNCAALPEHLVESLFFGHKKGAFTGAHQDKPGLFKEADGGALFLDEFGDLPLSIQAKLLRVSQDGVVVPVGSHQKNHVDVRIIAATNKNPLEEIQAGKLREDLYYRIATHTITVPTLRERCWDIPLLFVSMLKKIQALHPELSWLQEGGALPMDFVLSLLHRSWKGNVRELHNIAEQTARLNLDPGRFVPPQLGVDERARGYHSPASVEAQEEALDILDEALLKKAAHHLGIARRTLSTLLRTHSFPPPEPSEPFSDFLQRLHSHLSETMRDLLAQNNHSQVQFAADIGLSRSTVIKLIRTLGLKRPQDLPAEEIQRASRQTAGDMEAMAEMLQVSPRALKLYLSRSKSEESGGNS